MSLITLFVASLLGSGHCAAMCGGFVACYSGVGGGRITPIISYNLARLFIYALLGVAAGWLGQSVDLAASFTGIKNFSSILIGFLLIAWGLAALFSIGSWSTSSNRLGKTLTRAYDFCAGKIFNHLPTNWNKRAMIVGLLSGFLPCGWLYAFVALAAATAQPVAGALTMAVFWLGTVPYLVAVAGLSRLLSGGLRLYLPRITAVLFILAGVFSATGHLGLTGMHPAEHHHHH